MTTGRPPLLTMALCLAAGAALGAWWASGNFGQADWAPDNETVRLARIGCLVICVLAMAGLVGAWRHLGDSAADNQLKAVPLMGLMARIAGPVGLAALGLGLGIGATPSGQPDHLMHELEETVRAGGPSDTPTGLPYEWLGRVGPTIRTTRTGGQRMTVEALAYRGGDGAWHASRGAVQLTLAPGVLAAAPGHSALQYGDVLLIGRQPEGLSSRQEPTPSGPDWTRIARQRGVWLSLYLPARAAGQLQLMEEGPAWHPYTLAARAASGLGERLQRALDQVGGRDAGPVALALITGHLSGMDPHGLEAYQTTGTMHLLVVSGAHLALLAFGLTVVLGRVPGRWAGAGRWRVRLLALALLWGYALVAGLGQSVCRAVLMITLYEALSLAGRRPPPLAGLALVAGVMIIARPLLCWQVGFWLSVAAVAGIVTMTGPIETWLRTGRARVSLQLIDPVYRTGGPLGRPLRWARQALAVSLAAWLATAPVLLVAFGRVPVWGAIVNVPAMLLGQGALWGSLATAAMGPVPLLGEWAAVGCTLAVGGLEGWVRWASTWPGAELGRGSLALLPLLALGLAAGLGVDTWRRPGPTGAWGAVVALMAGLLLLVLM